MFSVGLKHQLCCRPRRYCQREVLLPSAVHQSQVFLRPLPEQGADRRAASVGGARQMCAGAQRGKARSRSPGLLFTGCLRRGCSFSRGAWTCESLQVTLTKHLHSLDPVVIQRWKTVSLPWKGPRTSGRDVHTVLPSREGTAPDLNKELQEDKDRLVVYGVRFRTGEQRFPQGAQEGTRRGFQIWQRVLLGTDTPQPGWGGIFFPAQHVLHLGRA